jgi:hypothetical protein
VGSGAKVIDPVAIAIAVPEDALVETALAGGWPPAAGEADPTATRSNRDGMGRLLVMQPSADDTSGSFSLVDWQYGNRQRYCEW